MPAVEKGPREAVQPFGERKRPEIAQHQVMAQVGGRESALRGQIERILRLLMDAPQIERSRTIVDTLCEGIRDQETVASRKSPVGFDLERVIVTRTLGKQPL